MAAATPRIAVSRGSPAAIIEPKVITRTTAATPTPISSAALLAALSLTALPPRLTFRPAFSPWATTSVWTAWAAPLTSASATL